MFLRANAPEKTCSKCVVDLPNSEVTTIHPFSAACAHSLPVKRMAQQVRIHSHVGHVQICYDHAPEFA